MDNATPQAPQSGGQQSGNPAQNSNPAQDSGYSNGNGNGNGHAQSPDSEMPTNVTPSKSEPDHYEVTINGKVRKMSLQELKNHASMAHAAQERFEEASKMRKEYESFKSTAQKDMIEALRAQGFSNDQIRDQMERWYTKEFIEPETLTPEQRKIKEYELQLEKYRRDEQEKLEKQQQEEQEQLTARQREYLQGQIIEALDKSGLPKTKMIASRMAFYMRENLLKGWDAPIDVIVSQVKQEREAMMHGEVSGLEGEALIQYLGEDVVNKIRKWDLTQLRARKQNQGSEMFQQSRNETEPNERVYSSEVTKRLREMRQGKR